MASQDNCEPVPERSGAVNKLKIKIMKFLITVNDQVDLTKEAKEETLNEVLKTFERRANAQTYKGKKRLEMQGEFILGAVALLDAIAKNPTQSQITPKIMFGIMRGEYIKADESIERPITPQPSELPQDRSKILLHLEGGVIQWIYANSPDIDIVRVDIDEQEIGEPPVEELPIDQVYPDGDFHLGYTDNDNSSREIHDELKKRGF